MKLEADHVAVDAEILIANTMASHGIHPERVECLLFDLGHVLGVVVTLDNGRRTAFRRTINNDIRSASAKLGRRAANWAKLNA